MHRNTEDAVGMFVKSVMKPRGVVVYDDWSLQKVSPVLQVSSTVPGVAFAPKGRHIGMVGPHQFTRLMSIRSVRRSQASAKAFSSFQEVSRTSAPQNHLVLMKYRWDSRDWGLTLFTGVDKGQWPHADAFF